MTESTHDKTKRKLLNHIKTIKPTHQVAIYFNNYDEGIECNDLMRRIKKPVSAAFKQTTMIWVLRVKFLTFYGVVGYVQILATTELDLAILDKVLSRYTYENQTTLKQREFERERYVNTISKQKLTNLAAYLGSERSPRRYAITNRPKINKGAEN